jgi:hypothetical protein
MKGGTALALFALLLPCTSPLCAAPIHGFTLGAGGSGGVALAGGAGFPVKAQPWWAAVLAVEVPLADMLGFGIFGDFHQAGASGVGGGFLYRGHFGLGAGAYLFGRQQLLQAKRLELLLGVAFGGGASFDLYSLTELLFFYPSLLLEPYLELHFPRLAAHTFSLTLPMRLDLRKDLDTAASVGLGLRWRWYPRWRTKAT